VAPGEGLDSARLSQARKLALALPEATEQDHFGRPSFRVRARIFATLPDAEHLNVMLDAFDVDGVMRKYPVACQELWWGKRLSGVRVDLHAATPDLIGELLAAAWRRQAPSSLKKSS
jgi:hypothetical protein